MTDGVGRRAFLEVSVIPLPLNLKFCPKVTLDSEEQPVNIFPMFVTFPVLKVLKSSDVSEEQPLNMEDILVTLPVVKLLLKVRVLRLEQLLNILDIIVTLFVLKLVLLKLRDARLEHPENIPLIFMVSSVCNLARLLNVVRLEQSLNQEIVNLGVTTERKETVVIDVLDEYHGGVLALLEALQLVVQLVWLVLLI